MSRPTFGERAAVIDEISAALRQACATHVDEDVGEVLVGALGDDATIVSLFDDEILKRLRQYAGKPPGYVG